MGIPSLCDVRVIKFLLCPESQSGSVFIFSPRRPVLHDARYVLPSQKIKIRSSCEIEAFVETHICKLCA